MHTSVNTQAHLAIWAAVAPKPRTPALETPTLHAHTSPAYATHFLEKVSAGSDRPGPKYHPPVFASPELLQIYCTSLFWRNIVCMWSVAWSLRPNLPLMLRPIYNIHFSTTSVCPPPSLVPSLQPHFSTNTVSSRAQSALSSLSLPSVTRASSCRLCVFTLSLHLATGLHAQDYQRPFLSSPPAPSSSLCWLLDYRSHGCEVRRLRKRFRGVLSSPVSNSRVFLEKSSRVDLSKRTGNGSLSIRMSAEPARPGPSPTPGVRTALADFARPLRPHFLPRPAGTLAALQLRRGRGQLRRTSSQSSPHSTASASLAASTRLACSADALGRPSRTVPTSPRSCGGRTVQLRWSGFAGPVHR